MYFLGLREEMARCINLVLELAYALSILLLTILSNSLQFIHVYFGPISPNSNEFSVIKKMIESIHFSPICEPTTNKDWHKEQ